MNFEFAKYTEITDFVQKIRPELFTQDYIRFFICPDVHDFWLCRILKDTNEDYETEEGSFVLEREKISMDRKGENLSISKVRKIIENDDLSNWDIQQSFDIKELIDMIDQGFGILNLKEESEKL
jgi:hypothetical protein